MIAFTTRRGKSYSSEYILRCCFWIEAASPVAGSEFTAACSSLIDSRFAFSEFDLFLLRGFLKVDDRGEVCIGMPLI